MQPSLADMSKDVGEKDYTVERLTRDRLKDLERLYSEVYGKAVPKNYFSTKYNSAYTAREFTGFIAYSHQRIPIAYYGVIPCYLLCGTQKILAAQSADTMTHPAHRHRGLFVELSKRTFELCKQEDINLIFGFPNQNSFPAMVHKLGWRVTHNMDLFNIALPHSSAAHYLRTTWITRKMYDAYASKILGKYRTTKKIISNSVIKDGFCGVARDKEFEQAKDYHTREVLNIEGTLVWCRIERDWIIGDMDVSHENFDSTLKKILDMANQLGVRHIQFHASPGTSLHDMFAARYESIPSFHTLIQPFHPEINIGNLKFTFADIDIF
jgi:hypothetical protein